jgi:RNA polymerase sigma-70 factor (ECF subfamily)
MPEPPGQAAKGSERSLGERRRLADALAENGRWLRTILAARGVEGHALDDVWQELATRATKTFSESLSSDALPAWLYRIAVVAALDYRRRTGRRRKLSTRYAASGLAPQEAIERDPLDWLVALEAEQTVRRALGELPPRDAELLLLKYTENWNYRQLSRRLGLSEAAIDGRLRRARQRLRTILAALAPHAESNVP